MHLIFLYSTVFVIYCNSAVSYCYVAHWITVFYVYVGYCTSYCFMYCRVQLGIIYIVYYTYSVFVRANILMDTVLPSVYTITTVYILYVLRSSFFCYNVSTVFAEHGANFKFVLHIFWCTPSQLFQNICISPTSDGFSREQNGGSIFGPSIVWDGLKS